MFGLSSDAHVSCKAIIPPGTIRGAQSAQSPDIPSSEWSASTNTRSNKPCNSLAASRLELSKKITRFPCVRWRTWLRAIARPQQTPSRPRTNGSTANSVPPAAIQSRSRRVETPSYTPSSTRRRLPCAWRARQARSAMLVCVSAASSPRKYRTQWKIARPPECSFMQRPIVFGTWNLF